MVVSRSGNIISPCESEVEGGPTQIYWAVVVSAAAELPGDRENTCSTHKVNLSHRSNHIIMNVTAPPQGYVSVTMTHCIPKDLFIFIYIFS